MPPPVPFPLPVLRAALARLIPADEFPGALEAGVDHYVVQQLAGDAAGDRPLLLAGLAALDGRARERVPGIAGFADLTADHQDALLRACDAAQEPFFVRLVELAHEGFYADPGNGGNRDAVAWHMLGYDPRGAARPGASAQTPPGP